MRVEPKSLPLILSIHAALSEKLSTKDGSDVWKFKSDDGTNDAEAIDSLRSHGLDAAGHSWLPFRIKLQIDPTDGSVTIQEYSDAALAHAASSDMYELTAVQACVTDPSPKATAKVGHPVAHIRVPG